MVLDWLAGSPRQKKTKTKTTPLLTLLFFSHPSRLCTRAPPPPHTHTHTLALHTLALGRSDYAVLIRFPPTPFFFLFTGKRFYERIALYEQGVQYTYDKGKKECTKTELPAGSWRDLGVPGELNWNGLILNRSVYTAYNHQQRHCNHVTNASL